MAASDVEEHRRAAAQHAQAGQWEAAGRAYEAAGDFAPAAECYLRAQNLERALIMFQSAGDTQRVSEILRGPAAPPPSPWPVPPPSPWPASPYAYPHASGWPAAPFTPQWPPPPASWPAFTAPPPHPPAPWPVPPVSQPPRYGFDLPVPPPADSAPPQNASQPPPPAMAVVAGAPSLTADLTEKENATSERAEPRSAPPAPAPPSSAPKPEPRDGAILPVAADPFAALDGFLGGESRREPRKPSRPPQAAEAAAAPAPEPPKRPTSPPPRGAPAPQASAPPGPRAQTDLHLLKRVAVFGGLARKELQDLYHMSERLTYERGQVIIEQGRPGKGLVVVSEGRTRVLHYENEREVVSADLGPGTYVGEMSLIDDAPTSARVVAMEHVEALRIPADAFRYYLFTHDQVALRVYRTFTATLVQRLRQATKQFAAVENAVLFAKDSGRQRAAVRFQSRLPVSIFKGGENYNFETVNFSELGMLLRDLEPGGAAVFTQNEMVEGEITGPDGEITAFKGQVVRIEESAGQRSYAIRRI